MGRYKFLMVNLFVWSLAIPIIFSLPDAQGAKLTTKSVESLLIKDFSIFQDLENFKNKTVTINNNSNSSEILNIVDSSNLIYSGGDLNYSFIEGYAYLDNRLKYPPYTDSQVLITLFNPKIESLVNLEIALKGSSLTMSSNSDLLHRYKALKYRSEGWSMFEELYTLNFHYLKNGAPSYFSWSIDSKVKSSLSNADIVKNTLNLNSNIFESGRKDSLSKEFLAILNNLGYRYKVVNFKPLTINFPTVKAEYLLDKDNIFSLISNPKTLGNFLSIPKQYRSYNKSSGNFIIKNYKGGRAVAVEGLAIKPEEGLKFKEFVRDYMVFKNQCLEVGRSYLALNSNLEVDPLLLENLLNNLTLKFDFEFKEGFITFLNPTTGYSFDFPINTKQ